MHGAMPSWWTYYLREVPDGQRRVRVVQDREAPVGLESQAGCRYV